MYRYSNVHIRPCTCSNTSPSQYMPTGRKEQHTRQQMKLTQHTNSPPSLQQSITHHTEVAFDCCHSSTTLQMFFNAARSSTFSDDRRLRVWVTICPALENTRSDCACDAGMAKRRRASAASSGNLTAFKFVQRLGGGAGMSQICPRFRSKWHENSPSRGLV